MRYGVTDALRQYLEGVPTKARPILETLTTAATDIRDQYSEWLTADSTSGFDLFPEWVQLEGSGLTTILENTTQNTGADITALTAPLSSPLNVALIEWSEASSTPEDEILGATAYLDPRRDGLSPVEVARFYAAIFQLVNITDEGGEQVWNLRQLAADIVDADPNGAAGNVSFSFGLHGRGPVIGARPPIIERGTVIEYYAKPATVLMVWAIKADGSDAGNVAWRCDANASQVTSNGHVISRRTLTVLDDEFATAPLQYTISTAQSGVPVCSITNNGTFSDATIQWTGDGNDFDLGQTPGSDTDLQLTLQYATPSDSEVRGYLYDSNSAAWVRFYDGDVIGQDNSADPAVVSGDIYANNGADLTGVSRLQAYDVKVELDTSSLGAHTPRLFRVGLIEVEREALDGLVEFGETAYAIDPVTSQSEISQLKLFLSRDGVRDYRSWAEELFASSALNKTEFRIWVGHPDLARQDWLHIDDYIVAGYSPSATGISVDCVSSLQYALATIPPESGNARSPIVFDGTTLQATYNSVLNTHVGLATRYRGVGIQDNTTTVAKTIDRSIEAIDVLRELTFLDGSALISSQGRFKVQRIVDATDPTFIEAPLVAFERDEVEVTAVTAGFERRITQFGVPYGWADGEYAGERETSAPTTVLENFGLRGTLGKQMLDDSIAQWIDTAALADRIGDRMIALFATGCIQMRIRTAVPHPHLEPGDPIALDQDVFVGYDPLNARSLRGRAGMRGRVVQCHDIMGTDFTLWLLPAVSSGKTQITVVNTLKGLGVSSSDVPSSAVTQYEGDINHNALLNYDANRHIDHTAVSISTDSGLDGGGDLTASRTISLAFNELSDRTFAGTDKLVFYSPGGGGHFTDIASGIPISVFQNTSLLDTISAGTGIAVTGSGTSRTISIDYDASNLITDATEISPTAVASGDWLLIADTSDSLNLRKAQVSNWPYKGTVTSVAGGLGLTATGSDAVTLNVGEGDGILVGADTVGLDFSATGLSDATAATGDFFAFWDSDASAMRNSLASNINLSIFQNTTLLAGVSAGTGIAVTGTGTSRTIAIDYDASNLITDATDAVSVASGDWILIADADATPALGLRKAQVSTWPYKGTVTSVSGGAGLTATGSDAVTLNVGAGDGISVGLDTVSLNIDGLTDVSTETAPDNKMLGTDQLVFSRGSALFKDTANTIPLSAFNDDLGYKNNQAGAGITITSGPTYNTISVNGASGGSGFFQTAWAQATTPISSDAMVFGDGGLTGTASTVLFSNVPVSIFQDNGYYALNSALTSHVNNTSNPHSVTKAQVGLGNVENTALSGWAGSTAITTLGTISTGTVPAANVGAGQFSGAFTIQGAFAPSANNTYALGASGAAWAKVWTYDLDVANNTIFGGNLTVGNTSGDLFIPNGQVLADGGGTVSAPSYSFDNDLNTGIYPAGADTLAFATGGTQRVTIDSSGRVGIGTSPAYKLDVNGAANFGANVYHRIGGTPVFATSGGFTYYYGNTNGIAWRNAADSTTQMALDSNGNLAVDTDTLFVDAVNDRVGINNGAPSETLQVSSGNLYLPASNTNTGALVGVGSSDSFTVGGFTMPHYGLKFAYYTGETGVSFNVSGYYGQRFFTGGAERIKIASNGNVAFDTDTLFVDAVNNRVGLGTNAPARLLELKAGEPWLRFNPTAVSGAYIVGAADGALKFTPEATWTPTLTLISGNVGIGVNSSVDRLTVGPFSGSNALTIGAGTGSYSSLYFGDGASGSDRYRGYLEYSHASDSFFLGTNSSQRLRIDSGGTIYLGASESIGMLLRDTGISSAYKAVTIGWSSGITQNVALAVDVAAIPGGSFNGTAQTFLGTNGILTPNTAGSNWIGVIGRLSGEDTIAVGPNIANQGRPYGPLFIKPTAVGINTISPGQALHVVGNMRLGQGSNNFIEFYTGANWFYYLAGSGNNFNIDDYESTRFFDAAYGSGGATKYATIMSRLTVYNGGGLHINTNNNKTQVVLYNQLSASGTQARRYEVARLTRDYNDWNSTATTEIELYETYYGAGFKKKYSVHWGFNNAYGVRLMECSGIQNSDNRFQVTVSAPVHISGDLYYVSVYIDVRYYTTINAKLTANSEGFTTTNPPAIGQMWINNSPSPTNISDFTPDSAVTFQGDVVATV